MKKIVTNYFIGYHQKSANEMQVILSSSEQLIMAARELNMLQIISANYKLMEPVSPQIYGLKKS